MSMSVFFSTQIAHIDHRRGGACIYTPVEGLCYCRVRNWCCYGQAQSRVCYHCTAVVWLFLFLFGGIQVAQRGAEQLECKHMVGFLGKGVGEVPHLFQLAQIAIADDVAHRAYVLLFAAVSRDQNTVWLLAWDMGRVKCVCPVGVLAAAGLSVFPRGKPATRNSEIRHRNTP